MSASSCTSGTNLMRYKQAEVAVWATSIVVWVMDYVSSVAREKIV